jgi:hypothetical protein
VWFTPGQNRLMPVTIRDRGAAVVRLDTYADSPVSVPFYERHMGYTRRAIVFQKPL